LDVIDSALCVICLDKPPVPSTQAPITMEDATHSITGRQTLHGDGIGSNSLNRWFDKTNNVCTFVVLAILKLLKGLEPSDKFNVITR
jgi:carnitine O-acetyltransferase